MSGSGTLKKRTVSHPPPAFTFNNIQISLEQIAHHRTLKKTAILLPLLETQILGMSQKWSKDCRVGGQMSRIADIYL